jgi:SOS-response transcriptional repressor LexA
MKANRGLVAGKSLREIGEEIGVGRKPQIVSHHIKQLEKRGILRENGDGNYVVLDTPVSSVAYINLYSCTAECGPNGFFGNDTVLERVPLPTKTFGITNPKDFFLIKARGDSMEPMASDGDLILAKVQEEALSSGSIAIVIHENMPDEEIYGRKINGVCLLAKS